MNQRIRLTGLSLILLTVLSLAGCHEVEVDSVWQYDQAMADLQAVYSDRALLTVDDLPLGFRVVNNGTQLGLILSSFEPALHRAIMHRGLTVRFIPAEGSTESALRISGPTARDRERMRPGRGISTEINGDRNKDRRPPTEMKPPDHSDRSLRENDPGNAGAADGTGLAPTLEIIDKKDQVITDRLQDLSGVNFVSQIGRKTSRLELLLPLRSFPGHSFFVDAGPGEQLDIILELGEAGSRQRSSGGPPAGGPPGGDRGMRGGGGGSEFGPPGGGRGGGPGGAGSGHGPGPRRQETQGWTGADQLKLRVSLAQAH